MESGRGSDALAAARAAARARREAARELADQTISEPLTPEPEAEAEVAPEVEVEPGEPSPEPEVLPVPVDLPAAPQRTPDRHFGQGVTQPQPRPARAPRPPRTPRAPRPPRTPTGTPAWYPPLVGAWSAVFVVVATLDAAAVRLAGAAVLVAAVVGFFALDRAPARTPPSLLTASLYAGAVVASAVVAWVVAREAHPAAGAVLAAVLMTGLVTAYERRP